MKKLFALMLGLLSCTLLLCLSVNAVELYVDTELVQTDVPYTLDVPAQIIGNRTMVPARFVSESLGCVVTWYNETQTAAVANKTKGEHIYVTKTGKRYHYSGTCNGGTYYEATLAEAMGRGLTPCDKCVLTKN